MHVSLTTYNLQPNARFSKNSRTG